MPIGGNIAGPGAPPVPPKWVVDYEVDFTAAASAHDFTGGTGTKTMKGVTWTADSIAKATTFETVEGSGLVIEPVQFSDFAIDDASAPRLTATISDLSPSAGNSSIVAVQAVGSVTSSGGDVAEDYQAFGIVVSDSSWENWAAYRRMWQDSLSLQPGEKVTVPVSDDPHTYSHASGSLASAPAYHEMTLFPGGSGQALAGTSYPSWPMTGTAFAAPFSYDNRGADSSSFEFKPSNLRAGVMTFRAGAATSGFTVTWTKLRVLRQVMS